LQGCEPPLALVCGLKRGKNRHRAQKFMQFDRPLLQLPIRFCGDTLAREVAALPESAWSPHPQGFAGNDAVPLVSPGGEITNTIKGPMAATEHLRACPYIMALMDELGAVWGRSRLMGLAPGAQVRPHVDIHYYWRTHIRIHIPVVTNPGVRFTCGGDSVHMAPGECWIFDSFQLHDVQNQGADKRVHLVLDTVGGSHLWDLIDAAKQGEAAPAEAWAPAGNAPPPSLQFEHSNIPDLMSSWELRCHVDFLRQHSMDHPALGAVMRRLDKFMTEWDALWVRFGSSDDGLAAYRAAIEDIRRDLPSLGGDQIALSNQAPLYRALDDLVFARAVAPQEIAAAADVEDRTAPGAIRAAEPKLYRPIVIVSAPRSGSSLLFETLARAPDLYTIGGESHGIIEGIEALSPAAHGWESNRLTEADASDEIVGRLAEGFYAQLRDRSGRPPAGGARMLEKTPKNALRIPFLAAAWPDAGFVLLHRDTRQTLSSMMEAWVSGRFRTYPTLPDWSGPPWSLLLVPGWRDLAGRPIPEIVAEQWKATIATMLDDLEKLPPDRVTIVSYADLLANPQASIEQLAQALGLGWDHQLGAELPLSRHTVSRPDPDKWQTIAHVIEAIWPMVEETDARLSAFVAARSA
jgi:hypothetical protein